MIGANFQLAVVRHTKNRAEMFRHKMVGLRRARRGSQLGWYEGIEGFRYDPIPLSRSLVIPLQLPGERGNDRRPFRIHHIDYDLIKGMIKRWRWNHYINLKKR